VVREGNIYYGGHTSIYEASLRDVGIRRAVNLSYNQRCNRLAATEDLFIGGYVTYYDKNFSGTLQSVARSGCALGATPANGMVYFTPSACGCFTQLRGYNCLTPESPRPPLDDGKRLERGRGRPSGAPPAPAAAAPAPAAAALAPAAAALAPAAAAAVLAESPIADEWLRWGERAASEETKPVELPGGDRIVARVQRHQVERRDARGTAQWCFVAGGRVSSPPIVVADRVVFGAHDGWVYALELAGGALAWRYLAAPGERKMVCYGQVESTWPVYGVTIHEGLVVASAGRHPEISGGVVVAGLRPDSGDPLWRRTLAKSVAVIASSGGKAGGTIVPESFLNEAPVADGERIRIGKFAFSPAQSDAELRSLLDTPPPKKR
jgi:hypothetical protein